MKRRDFLQRFGIGVAAAVAAPSLVKAALPEDTSFVVGNMRYPEDGIMQSGSLTTDMDAEFAMRQELDKHLFLGEQYTSSWEEEQRRREMAKHWPELVKRYGKDMSITDFLMMKP